MAEYKILQETIDGVKTDIYPITHPDAVRDENGKSVNEAIGNLTELQTTEKSNLVGAINEVKNNGGMEVIAVFTEDDVSGRNLIFTELIQPYSRVVMQITRNASLYTTNMGNILYSTAMGSQYTLNGTNCFIYYEMEKMGESYVLSQVGSGTNSFNNGFARTCNVGTQWVLGIMMTSQTYTLKDWLANGGKIYLFGRK